MLKCFGHSIRILLFYALLQFPVALYGQFLLFADRPIDIEAEFSLHSIDAGAKESIFNVLKIKNNGNQGENIILNITVPNDWGIVGPDKIELQINPHDSLFIPIRVAVGSMVRGDIGYSVIASLTDTRGNTIKNAYCFIKIPRKVDLKVRILDRIAYIEPLSGTTKFSIQLSNKGNREEPISFFIDGKTNLGIGELKNNLYSKDILLKPYSDTIIPFTVSLLSNEALKKSSFSLEVSTSTIDSTYTSTLWFIRLDSKLSNYIPPSEKPLSIQILGMGLMDANRVPTISTSIEGKTLFKGESDVYYYYRNFASRDVEDFYKNTRIILGSNIKKWNIEFGDNFRTFQTRTNGRGGYLGYKGDKLNAQFVANREINSNINNYATLLSYELQQDLGVLSGASYSNSNETEFESKAITLGVNTKFLNHSLNAKATFNEVTKDVDGEIKHNEFGADLRYNSKINNFNNDVYIYYNSPLFYGIQPGYFRANIRTYYQLPKGDRIYLYYRETKSTKPQISNGITIRTQEFSRRQPSLEYHHYFSPTIQVFGGPAIETSKYSGLSYFLNNEFYENIGYKFILNGRFRNHLRSFIISPKFEVARVNVISNPFDTLNNSSKTDSYNYQYFSLNVMTNSFNLLGFYTSGPRNPLDQVAYSYLNKPVRRIHIIPSYSDYIYKNILRTELSISYSNDIVSKSSYSNFTGQLYWYLPKNWTFNLLLVYTVQSRTNPQEVVEKFQNIYLEAGIKKEFDINQPRVKYYNIELNFFKDYNGNFTQEENEPGIKNVLVSISKERSNVVGSIPSDIFLTELLSDNTGKVIIENIPEGTYKFVYNPVGGDVGTYSKAYGDIEVDINKNGSYYFPFVERNKVFGKIILNRSRLSGLGRLDLSNVRITATDSYGRSYSTLTNKEGEFVLYAPVTDEYILNINNIFYENFDLRQNNFLVQFNGYKQFEVNFVFDEKIRRINFAATDSELQTGIIQVRRTTISGKVQDVNTQQPVRARVNLVDTRTNSIITSTNSSSTSGEYTLNFMAGDNFLLEVISDDYWYLSENLALNQITTFMNITRDVLLRPVSIGSKIELNIKFGINSAFLAPESVAELNRLLRQIKNNPTVKLEIQGHSDELEAIRSPGIALERANAVASYLIENGYSNLEVKSYDNTVPAASNDTEEGRARNRRIEVVVLSR